MSAAVGRPGGSFGTEGVMGVLSPRAGASVSPQEGLDLLGSAEDELAFVG